MRRKQLFYLTMVSLSFCACRNEADLLTTDKAKTTQQFSTFSGENSGRFDYAAAFKKLSLRHDQIHSRQFTGISPNGKSLIKDEHIAFGLHSKPFKDKNGNVFMIFPRINSGKVTGLVAAYVNKERTKVKITDVKEKITSTLAYKINIAIFQSAENRKNPLGVEDVGIEDICGAQNPNIPSIDEVAPCNIDEIILPPKHKDENNGGDDGDWGDWGDWGDDPSDPDIGDQTGTCDQFMDCGGGSGETPSNNNDPCTQAKLPAENATSISKTSAFATAKTTILQNGQVESGAYLMPDGNGQLVASGFITGSDTHGTIQTPSTSIAIIHDHLDGGPPSSGDVYSLIKTNNENASLVTSYLIDRNPDGSAGNIYALIVTDPVAAKNFADQNPSVQATPTSTPNFPEPIYSDIDNLGIRGFSNATILSYILDKYNVGIALTQLTSAGNFKKVNIVATQNSDKTTNLANVPCTN